MTSLSSLVSQAGTPPKRQLFYPSPYETHFRSEFMDYQATYLPLIFCGMRQVESEIELINQELGLDFTANSALDVIVKKYGSNPSVRTLGHVGFADFVMTGTVFCQQYSVKPRHIPRLRRLIALTARFALLWAATVDELLDVDRLAGKFIQRMTDEYTVYARMKMTAMGMPANCAMPGIPMEKLAAVIGEEIAQEICAGHPNPLIKAQDRLDEQREWEADEAETYATSRSLIIENGPELADPEGF